MPQLRRCPWSQITDETWVVYGWWRDWKDLQALPDGGDDIMDQPAYVAEAIRQCEGVYAKVESEMHEKHQKDMERTQARAKVGR